MGKQAFESENNIRSKAKGLNISIKKAFGSLALHVTYISLTF